MCGEGLSCESGATGYTCGELPAVAVVPAVFLRTEYQVFRTLTRFFFLRFL